MSDTMSNDGKTENCTVEHLVSHDSEYDDALGVSDSLEVTINDNDGTINVECKEDTDNKGKLISLARQYSDFCYLRRLLITSISY